MNKAELSETIKEIQNTLKQLRRDIEANPELTEDLSSMETLVLTVKAGIDQKYFRKDQTHV